MAFFNGFITDMQVHDFRGSHDEQFQGCFALIRSDDGARKLITHSHRLQTMIQMAYANKTQVHVTYRASRLAEVPGLEHLGTIENADPELYELQTMYTRS